jgi:hypothetical protein
MGACASKKPSQKKSDIYKPASISSAVPPKPKTNIEKLLQQKTEPKPAKLRLSDLVVELWKPRKPMTLNISEASLLKKR